MRELKESMDSNSPDRFTPKYINEVLSKHFRMDPSDDDKLVTQVSVKGCVFTPPEGYLIGKLTHFPDGMLVEYVKK